MTPPHTHIHAHTYTHAGDLRRVGNLYDAPPGYKDDLIVSCDVTPCYLSTRCAMCLHAMCLHAMCVLSVSCDMTTWYLWCDRKLWHYEWMACCDTMHWTALSIDSMMSHVTHTVPDERHYELTLWMPFSQGVALWMALWMTLIQVVIVPFIQVVASWVALWKAL